MMELKKFAHVLCACLTAACLAACAGTANGEGKTTVTAKSTSPKAAPVQGSEDSSNDHTPVLTENGGYDFTPQLNVVKNCTDEFLTALKTGDINTLADYTLPESSFGRLFEENRHSETFSQIVSIVFGDMVWTHSQSSDARTLLWLEATYSERGQWSQSYVVAGVKEMLYFGEYFVLNYADGETIPDDYEPTDESDALAQLEKTVARLPLLKNNWGIKCTLPNADGKVYFDLDDDFLMDYTRLLATEKAVTEDVAAVYVGLLAEDRGTVGDEEAETEKSCELRAEFADLLKAKKLEEAWQLIKPKSKGNYSDVTEYGDLTPDEQEEADRYIDEELDVVVADFSTSVFDGTKRRHYFSQIYYDAFAEPDEADIAAWLADNDIKQSDGGIFFDITEDDRLAAALNAYFELLERIHA